MSIGKLDGLTGSTLDRSKSPKRVLQEQFARVMVQELRASLPEEAMGGPFGDAFGSVFDDAMAKAIVDGGGMEINWGVQDSQRMANPLPDGARISSAFSKECDLCGAPVCTVEHIVWECQFSRNCRQAEGEQVASVALENLHPAILRGMPPAMHCN